VAGQARSYFKPGERVDFIGIRAPEIRRIAQEIHRQVRSCWSVDDASRFCGLLLRSRYLEAKAAGILLLGRYHRNFEPELLSTARQWLESGSCSNWATTDALSGLVIAPLLGRWPEQTAELANWATAASLWVRRAATVSLTPLARRGEHLELAYRIVSLQLNAPEDLIHKAAGWLLRECGRTDARRLEKFLLHHGRRVPRTAVRYAVERLPAARRRKLLEQTRSDRMTYMLHPEAK